MIDIEYLRKVPFFTQLSDEQLNQVNKIAKKRLYKRGAIVIVEGSKGEYIYIVKTGKVKIYKTSEDGREIILDIKSSGDAFAEVTLFSDALNPATVKTIDDTEIICIKNSQIEGLILENPDIALGIIKLLNRRLLEAQRKIKSMALNDTYVRTAQTLLKLSEKYGQNKDGVIDLDINITREELASLVGTSRETVSRALSQFSKEEAITIKGRKISINDTDKLRAWFI